MSERDKDVSDDDRMKPDENGSPEDSESGDTSIEVEIKTDDDVPSDVREEDLPEDVEESREDETAAESDRFLRLAAEFDNYKKRTAREFEDIIKRANVRLLRELVDIVDNFERAMSADAEDHSHKAYRQGVELIYNQLSALLTKEGITPIDAVGKPFDPHYHEAVMQSASDEYDEGTVMQEIQKGYCIGDKVLRHSRVIVSSGGPKGDK